MKGIRARFSQTLASKVILSTVILSLGVITLAGSALNSRLSDGIRAVSLDSALTEARFTFFNAQYQLILSQNKTVEQRKQIIAGLIVESANRDVNADNKDIILVKFPNSKPSSVSYEMASSLIDPQSVPQDLRERVRKSKESQYQYAKIRYQDSILSDALFVGEPIKIPGGGMYEMYVVFALNTQSETLNLIRNSLVFTGFALILLIAMITWLVVRQVVSPVRAAARIANQFTEGDFSQRMKVESNDEIAALAHSYNEMAQSIEKQISRLENLSRVQQRFVSDVSHELRTPLTTLRATTGSKEFLWL